MQIIIHLLIITCIFALLGASLNVALGYTGLINLGHVAFFGVGAYTSAILSMNGLPYLLSLLAAGAMAGIFGWLLALITNKLKGDYLALSTLGFTFIAYSLFLNWKSLTRGPLGIPGIKKPNLFGLEIASNEMYLVFAIIITGISIVLMHKLMHSRYGKLLEGVRDDAIGLEARGKNVFRLKYQSLIISSFFAGIAGSLYAHYVTFIDPSTFYINDIIIILTIVIVGGLASIRGSVVAAFIIILVPELLRLLNLPSSIVGPARQIIYSLILIIILLYKPRGLFGKVDLH